MSTALQTVDPNSIQQGTPGFPSGSEMFFTEAQERMILKTFLGGASKEEAVVLLETVRRRRLDPFSRQVYFIKRWDAQKREDVWAIQTSIDGLRSIAERTGKYDGQGEPVYGEDEAGKFCKVTVYRKDWTSGRGATGIAYFNEFVQHKKDGSITKFWKDMPRLMLAKCAEALAIRKAFPEDTGGLYISEEMGQEPTAEKAPPAAPVVTVEAQPVEATPTAEKPRFPPTGDALWSEWAHHCKSADINPAEGLAKWKETVANVLGERAPSPAKWNPEQIQLMAVALIPSYAEDIPF